MKQAYFPVINDLGLHTRAATMVVKTASRFSSEITIAHGPMRANAKSIMGLLSLAARKGAKLSLEVHGEDQDEAFGALSTLIKNGFDEAKT